jgi:hypothetical protein
MHDVEELLERDVAAAAEDALQTIRPIERIAADVESKYSDLRGVQRGARTLLGRPEGVLGGDLLGNVLCGSYEEVDGAVCATHARHRDARPDDGAVRPDEAFVNLITWRLAGGEPLRQFQAAWQIVRKRHLLKRAGEEVGALAPENLAQALVDVQEAPLQIKLRHPDRREIDRRAEALEGVVPGGVARDDVGARACATFLHWPPSTGRPPPLVPTQASVRRPTKAEE